MKKPLPGKESKASPWFDKNGGGNQVETEKNIKDLIGQDKALEHIKSE